MKDARIISDFGTKICCLHNSANVLSKGPFRVAVEGTKNLNNYSGLSYNKNYMRADIRKFFVIFQRKTPVFRKFLLIFYYLLLGSDRRDVLIQKHSFADGERKSMSTGQYVF